MNNSVIVSLRDIVVEFDGQRILDGLNLDIHDKEFVTLLGPSGCGKTTTLRLIAGFLEPNSGKVLLKGEDITGVPPYKRPVNTVFQKYALFPHLNVFETVAFGLRLQKLDEKEIRSRCLEMLELVGINNVEKRMKQYPHEFSGGMRQRVVIAIAVACNPQILICDEPTTALDVTIQAQILELLKEMRVKYNLTIILITHDLGVVAKVADYVDVMYAGKIVETGTIDEIFYEPRHPYTWGLLSAMPDLDTADDRLYTIPGSPPNLLHEKQGDAFAPRNHYALNIDDEVDPPMFKISDTHFAATWLLDPRAPKVEMPPELKDRVARMSAEAKKIEEAE